MAADLQTPPYETLVDDNIAQVSQKIRFADLGRGVLALACLLFGYALVVAAFDLLMGGSDSWLPLTIRGIAFLGFLGAAGFLGFRVVLRFLTNVNPYYAARRLEESLPDAKNSLINWLDLKDQPLPPVIHKAVGMKAAHDVKEADPDLVANSRDVWKLGLAACVFLVGLVILFAIVPRQFGSLMARAFLPLNASTLSNRTTITVLKPALGDAVAPANQRVEFLAKIDGQCPPANSVGAPKLLYRYTTTDVAVPVPLEEDTSGNWSVRLGSDQLRTGVFWKITAGDASTPESQLRIRSQPFVTRFEAAYHYRPYRKQAPETVTMPNESMPQPRLLEYRGTDVVIKARVNTPIKLGSLELDLHGVKKIIPAELPASEPQTLSFRIGLEKSGTFRILFETPEGEKNVDRSPYSLDVMDDGAPLVDLVKPGKDLEAPANGTVLLAGVAQDDFGITGLTLKLQRGKTPLASLPFVPKVKLKFDNGRYPPRVEYVEVLPLDQLKSADNKLVSLAAGDEITYWLEAADNFDFPKPNVGKSKAYKIVIKDGLVPSKQQQQERVEAERTKEQHADQQAKEQEKQNQDNNQGKNESSSKKDGGSGQENKAGDGNQPDPKKNGGPNDNTNSEKSDGGSPDKKNPGDQKGNSPEEKQQRALEDQIAKTAEKLNEARANKSEKNGDTPPDKNPSGNPQSNPNDSGGKESKKDPSNPNDGGSKEPNQGEANPKGGKDTPAAEKKADSGKKGKPDDGKGGASEEGGGAKDKKGTKESDKKGGDGAQETAKTTPSKDKDNGDPTAKGDGQGKDPAGSAKSTGKKGDPDVREQGKTSDAAKTEPTDKKPKGEAKGADPKQNPGGEPKGETKAGEKGPMNPQAKGKEGKSPESGKEKDSPKEGKADGIASAKDDGKTPKNPPTKEEIDHLKELLKKNSPEADAAAKDLAERGQTMGDAELKKTLQDILRDAGREDESKKLEAKAPEALPPPQKVDDSAKDPGKLAKGADDGKSDQGNQASPTTGPKSLALADELKAITPEEAFARRLGDLQLDDIEGLKKRIGPDTLKKANVSDEEWQRFLDNARKYQELMKRARDRDDAKFLRGGAGKMASQGPRKVETNPNAVRDPLAGGQAAPPWEFRRAYEEFTRKTKTP